MSEQLSVLTTVVAASTLGIYNSSTTPSYLPWDTYNYCNAPHVKAEHYYKPANAPNATLVYLNVVTRHHKVFQWYNVPVVCFPLIQVSFAQRTPDNLFPSENELNPAEGWDCSDFIQEIYGGGTRPVNRRTTIPSWHPYLGAIWNGTCDAGQLTQAGLLDSVRHGKDFWSVYHDKLSFLKSVNEEDIFFRTSTELRTHQVAGGLLYGMDPNMQANTFPVHCQPQNIDSIVPNYPCPAADLIRNAYQSVPAWTTHIEENQALQDRLTSILGTSGLSAWSSWYDHFFDAFSSRTCHGHPLPCNSNTGACVSEDDAHRVFALGDFEYDYIWNSAENATNYVQLTFGVFFFELAENFKLFQAGKDPYLLRFYVGHDGSMVRLAAGLELGKTQALRWPALGSEIVMEVWRTMNATDYVRVLHEGTPVPALEWVELAQFITLLESQVPARIYQTCMIL